MTSKILRCWVIPLTFCAVGEMRALAQCVLGPIHVERIEGHVVFGFQNQYRILDRAEIQIVNSASSQTVASAVTDKNGYFEIRDVKPGKYILSTRSEALIPASVDLEVIKARGTPEKRLILVVLAADATRECSGTSIRVQRKTNVDRILSTAKRPAH